VSEGCANCYASRLAERFPQVHGFDHGTVECPQDIDPIPFSTIRFHPDRLDQPLRWKKPRRIFVCSMGDLFHEDVKEEWLDEVFTIMRRAEVRAYGDPLGSHTFMVLTKRPERMKAWMDRLPSMPNLWLGVTAENQEMADQRIPILLQIPAAKRFVSIEPMLGPVDLRNGEWASALLRLSWLHGTAPIGRVADHRDRGLDWVICGGETGPGARFMHPHWVENLRDQCTEAGVPFFFKGWGTRMMKKSDPNYMRIDGQEWKQFPEK
jgi:protein gp37